MNDLDRLARAVRAFVREVFPRLDYLGVYEYRVEGQSGALLDLSPAQSIGLPELAKVPMRPGFAGSTATLPQGSTVLVGFVNGDPARPFVAFHAAFDEEGFAPPDASIDVTGTLTFAQGSKSVARVDDDVDAGAIRIVTTMAAPTSMTLQHVRSGVPTGPPITVALGTDNAPGLDLPLPAVIASGAAKVKA